jgi:glucose 1-dehydrogenase
MVLKGKAAIVTGASRGIGRAIAVALAEAGADVALNCLQPDDEAEETARLVRETGRKGLLCFGDVASYLHMENAVSKTIQELGRLDLVVANAAFSERQKFWTADLEGIRRTVDVSMWGAFNIFRAAAIRMIDQGAGGVMVAVSSPHAFIPAPGAMAYNMAKAALEQMARTAALELADFGIRVNIISPGWTDTPGEREFRTESELATAALQLVAKRLADPAEIARVAVFLCDPASQYLNGSTIVVDGAQSLARARL